MAMTKWEYLVETELSLSGLKRRGEEGWELVCVVGWPRGGVAHYFKRPLVSV